MNTLLTYAAAIGALVLLILLWVLVQTLWRQVFSDQVSDPDVLADRRSCGDCGCKTVCENKKMKSTTH